MRLDRLQSVELLARLWKAAPLQGSADPGLERKFDRVTAKIERSVEAPRAEEYLRVPKSRLGDVSKVRGCDHGLSHLPTSGLSRGAHDPERRRLQPMLAAIALIG